MSGIEVAGLAFGVLPIIAMTAKAYRSAQDRIRNCRNYKDELRHFERNLRSRKNVFRNHLQLLLRMAIDKDQADDILSESRAASSGRPWLSQQLNRDMEKVLGGNWNHCKDIIEDIKSTLHKLDVLLQRLETEEVQATSIRSIIRRLRTSDLSKLDRGIRELRERNEDLKELRMQLKELKESSSAIPPHLTNTAIPYSYTTIRNTSHTLYETLKAAWTCGNADHVKHYAKLKVDTTEQADVTLRLAIMSQKQCARQLGRTTIHTRPIWLCVRSIDVNSTSSRGTQRTKRLRWADDEETSTPSAKIWKKTRSRDSSRKPIHAGNSPLAFLEENKFPPPGPEMHTATLIVNLGRDNICSILTQHSTGKAPKGKCVGYLENVQTKYMLYLDNEPRLSSVGLPKTKEDFYTIKDTINDVERDDFDPIYQLLLAKKLAEAVLQFHSTAWLMDMWSLSDIASFGVIGQISDDTLQNLHLTSDINQSQQNSSLDHSVEITAPALTREQAEIVHGIRNLTLFNLGCALLQIGCWIRLEDIKKTKGRNLDDPHLIQTVRLAAKSRLSKELGPRYRDIVLRCLSTDFGFGDDLHNTELQTAVKTQVISELEDMIRDWTLRERPDPSSAI